MTRLYCSPPRQMFQRGQEQDLLQYLEELDRSTSISPLSCVSELRLRGDGTTEAGGYRLTSNCFRQIAQKVAPGLSTLLPNLVGNTRTAKITDDMVDAQQARHIWNAVLDLRFGLLQAYSLVRDEAARRIDGMVGHKHKCLENSLLLSHVRDMRTELAPDMQFHSAVVLGRRMLLWYRDRSPVCTMRFDGQAWPFYRGVYFCNGETTGTSVRGSSVLFTRKGTCMQPFARGGRVNHSGQDFSRRLDRLLHYVFQQTYSAAELQRQLSSLHETSLGLGSLSAKEQKAVMNRFLYAAGERRVPRQVGLAVWEAALCSGRDIGPITQEIRFAARVIAQRTRFDLFCSLVDTARRLPPNLREVTEQLAYLLLTSQFTF